MADSNRRSRRLQGLDPVVYLDLHSHGGWLSAIETNGSMIRLMGREPPSFDLFVRESPDVYPRDAYGFYRFLSNYRRALRRALRDAEADALADALADEEEGRFQEYVVAAAEESIVASEGSIASAA